jgi:hypothetical protein
MNEQRLIRFFLISIIHSIDTVRLELVVHVWRLNLDLFDVVTEEWRKEVTLDGRTTAAVSIRVIQCILVMMNPNPKSI